jgi:hypothetical protein
MGYSNELFVDCGGRREFKWSAVPDHTDFGAHIRLSDHALDPPALMVELRYFFLLELVVAKGFSEQLDSPEVPELLLLSEIHFFVDFGCNFRLDLGRTIRQHLLALANTSFLGDVRLPRDDGF